MSVRTRVLRAFGVLTATAMFTLAAGVSWSVAEDYNTRDIVPSGVELPDGTNLSGLPKSEARRIVQDRVATRLFEPLEVAFSEEVRAFDPTSILSIDIDAMIEAAFDPNSSATIAERTLRRAGALPPGTLTVEPVLSVDRPAIAEWVADVAADVDTAPVNAAIYIDEGVVVMRNSAPGLKTNVDQSAARIANALLSGAKRVNLAVKTVDPEVTNESLGKTIVVRISERRLYLYDGLTLEKTYRVAVGASGYSTPLGSWRITLKRYMPSWRNPGSDWAKDMPQLIPPGPNNPLGTRALNLNAPAIRIHGTTKDYSIGTAASRGCVRMHRWDIEDLYERVEVGTPVLILR